MCGRYTLYIDLAQVEARFRARAEFDAYYARYNIAPGQKVPSIFQHSSDTITEAMWGWDVPWMKTSRGIINARSETAPKKRTFTSAFREQRCIIPSQGFYEWKPTGAKKQPYLFSLRDEALFGFAGLYQENEDGARVLILTCEPNTLVSDVHDRMPVMLREEDESVWLDPDTDNDHLSMLCTPYPASKMVSYPVSPAVNIPTNNDPQLIEAIK